MLFQMSNCVQKSDNTYYKQAMPCNTVEDLRAITQFDHVMGQFRDYHRNKKNWLCSDILYADLDIGTTIEEFQNNYKGYEYYIVTSKNHQLPKLDKKSKETHTRDRFHIFFPIPKMTNKLFYEAYLTTLAQMIGADENAIDCSRYYDASPNSIILYNSGECIIGLLDTFQNTNQVNKLVSIKKPTEDHIYKKELTTVPKLIEGDAEATYTYKSMRIRDAAIKTIVKTALADIENANDGSRNATYHKQCCYLSKLANGGFPIGDWQAKVQKSAKIAGLDASEIITTLSSAISAGGKITFIIEEPDPAQTKEERVAIVEKIIEYVNNTYSIRENIVLGIRQYKTIDSNTWIDITDKFEKDLWCEMYNIIKVSFDVMLRVIYSSNVCYTYDAFADYYGKYNDMEPSDFEGIDYIAKFADCVKTTNREAWQLYFRRWLIASVGQSLGEVTNHSVLILIEPKGGTGKSAFLRRLCPMDEYVMEGQIKAGDKDSLISLTTNALISLDEFESTSNNSDYQSLKSIITRDKVKLRTPFDRNEKIMKRRASFVATSNSFQIIREKSGTRRWLCATIDNTVEKPIDYQFDDKIRTLALEQAYRAYRSGEKFWFDSSDIDGIIENNNEYTIADSETDLVSTFIRTPDNNHDAYSLTEIIIHIQKQIDNAVKLNSKKLAEILINKGYIRKHTERGNKYFCKLITAQDDILKDGGF